MMDKVVKYLGYLVFILGCVTLITAGAMLRESTLLLQALLVVGAGVALTWNGAALWELEKKAHVKLDEPEIQSERCGKFNELGQACPRDKMAICPRCIGRKL
jgi:hypothetical protein